ncbi:MAG: diguanylate cyclase [Desulfomonile tiedjei]|nr:diguanylate cyclase [Desulfomonile tiedjei]
MRILVAEDDAITRRLLEARLSQGGYDVAACADGSQAWEMLSRDDAPSLVVLDWMMPGMDGVTICREIRKIERQQYTYIILLTAKTRKEDVIEGLEAGADDYILKPFDAHELQVRVRAGSRIIRLQQDLMSALSASEYQASHDPLTGLWNRKAIVERLDGELARAGRETANVGVIIADLDHFKCINDSCGHLAGDAVLREVASRLVATVRPYDAVGRYGGEEFLMVLPSRDAEAPEAVAERLCESFSGNAVLTSEGAFEVTMSLGVVSVPGATMCDADSVVRATDEALYRAKALGRNRVQVGHFPGSDAGLVANNMTIEAHAKMWIQ